MSMSMSMSMGSSPFAPADDALLRVAACSAAPFKDKVRSKSRERKRHMQRGRPGERGGGGGICTASTEEDLARS